MIEKLSTVIGYIVVDCLLMIPPILTGVSLVAWRLETTVCFFVASFAELMILVIRLRELSYIRHNKEANNE